MTDIPMYHDGSRRLQDRFATRKLADRLVRERSVSEATAEAVLRTYAAFNARDIESVLSGMHPDVDSPNGMEGVRVRGHDAVRDYWTRQWQTIDPSVEPRHMTTTRDGRVDVEVHQVVRDLAGRIVKDEIVHHVYAFEAGLIISMEIETRP